MTVAVALDPTSLNRVGMGLVFVAVNLFLTSFFFLCLRGMATRFLGEERAQLYQGAALRQSWLLALYATGILWAHSARLLVWWVALLGLVFVLLLEFSYRQLSDLKR